MASSGSGATSTRARRTGSYPFKYIAEDFGLPYSVPLCYAEAVRLGANVVEADWLAQRAVMVDQGRLWAVRAGDEARRLLPRYDLKRFHAAVATLVIPNGL